ncbi:hypothetical protein WR25_19432 [Diploscapter pachys]|uniref:Protein kinase domain-containing protein n=1 Tax=Diploscapter pachys TaxID=2018661 RepID=A0A2A2LDS2_9BILA|nr:hypothetical protein WR25_19432 [Diploscapter pachys]
MWTMADERCDLHHQRLEQRVFNTGPQANRAFPLNHSEPADGSGAAIPSGSASAPSNSANLPLSRPSNMMSHSSASASDAALQPHNEDSSDMQLRVFAPQQPNESSNLSSAGSISDREPETPQRPNQMPSIAASEPKKPVRKRRRNDETTPKVERKITEFCQVKNSPKRVNMMATGGMAHNQQVVSANGGAFGAGQGGNGNGDIHQQMLHPLPHNQHYQIHQGHGMENNGGQNNHYWTVNSPSPINRTTPTPANQGYSSDSSNSNSNQSPPSTRIRMDSETQTESSGLKASEDNLEEIAKRDRLIEDYRKQIEELQAKVLNERRKNDASKETIKRLLMEKNEMDRKALREKTMADNPRLGYYKLVRTGDSFKDQWQDGFAFEELAKKGEQIVSERNEIATASTLLKKRKPLGIGKEGASTSKRSASNSLNAQFASMDSGGQQPSTSASLDDAIFRRPEEPKEINYQEYIELEEIYKLRREHLKKEEADLAMEKEKLEKERQLHLRELKRSSNEMASSYKDHALLNKRYLMLSLLGKGGFSEVWRAFDLEENRYVACKIHHVNKDWKEEKKANYVKHAMREKDIHKTLDHCRIVKLYDLFTIDNHSFCTVLEYCPGNDLDFYLKQNKQISEKEARSIIMQVVSALVYLNEKRDPIIHYDLKPANILLESGNACGAIKITDFGLSKVMEGSMGHDDDIELTSQFAGTYWYLPPETFIVNPPPKISCKVDVWSVGVIFYQCIYGKKPFGDSLTQQKILELNTIVNAKEVAFPPKPQVSSVAQDFIRRCLQYRKEDRADVFELAKHELFRPRGAKSSSGGAASISSPSVQRTPSVGNQDE